MNDFFKATAVVVFAVIFLTAANAQELNCRVQINSQQIQTTNKRVFEEMQKTLYEFLNNQRWTSHVFSVDERIELNFMINLTTQISSDEYKGNIQIQSSRPVFNTSYTSPMFNFIDNDFQFKFVEQEVLTFNENTHTSNLTSVLAYYVYIVLGLDYDSFGQDSGSEFFQKAERIVNNAQNEPTKGWRSFESRKNRYWLIENLMNETYAPVRECIYRYHRLGLDKMADKQSEGRAEIAEALQLLQIVHRKKPGSFLMQVFFDAKKDEILNIFSESFPEEKRRVYTVVSEVDPANASKYEQLVK